MSAVIGDVPDRVMQRANQYYLEDTLAYDKAIENTDFVDEVYLLSHRYSDMIEKLGAQFEKTCGVDLSVNIEKTKEVRIPNL